MASKSLDDGRQSHPTPSLMPHLASVALEAISFAVGLTKQPPRQHKDGAMVSLCCYSTQDLLGRGDQWNKWPRTSTNRLSEQWINFQSFGGCNNQLEGEGETQQHTNSCPKLWPFAVMQRLVFTTSNATINHTRSCERCRTSCWSMQSRRRGETNNNQPNKRGDNLQKLLLVLCLLVFVEIIII
jgi:hypothetical protein